MPNKMKSIYETIISSIGEDGKISEACAALPDDARFLSGFSFGFIAGAFEEILSPGQADEKKNRKEAAKISAAVTYLEPDTDEIRSWLLRHGCANAIGDHRLALICAKKGQLLSALQADQIEEPLFSGAGTILKALLESPILAESIENYSDGAEAVGLYLSHADHHIHNSIDGLLTVCAIKDLLARPAFSTDHPMGWTKDLTDHYKKICEKIISNPKWEQVVWNHVEADDCSLNWKGREAARKLKIDIWDCIFSKLQNTSANGAGCRKSAYYFELASTDNPQRFQTLVAYAEQNLPLKAIASGPAMEMGLGIKFQDHSYLDTMLQSLQNKDGVGSKLIEAGLWSRVIRNRHLAISALETWETEHYSPLMMTRLKALKKCEPDKTVKRKVAALLKKAGLS